ncbi:hypothetical protein Vretimale_15536 [Volvox reticuliferus]|uniref:Vitamin B6 photo-protection and homoeostasis-domain-containing protein n=1 Tax=Volvox reticuliferus TaxID=1737510 RepID=A0A8J4GQY1_9CHLO|nr:hypothetical protein Vretifemale_15130 [Volvox reticuliferus]GIM12115.1 hypothetical protein Vretimale_15536 [Volvox reticuliferus]
MSLHSAFPGSRPLRGRHVVRGTTQGVANTQPQPPPRALRQSYTLTEIHGSEEYDLLASPSSSKSSTPQPLNTPMTPTSSAVRVSLAPLASLPDSIRDLFLPPGYPSSVTPDYLSYQLWSMPTHVTGHLSHSLVTSSLLAAVGVSTSPAATVVLSASIKWIIKDGVGALGRLLVGSRFAAEFDEDPRRWRLVAELLSTAGLGLEVATSLYPQSFMLLACTGKFCQALAKGMGKPVFRVIQTHFARAQNVGAVAAKEEVWEVVAQMAGLIASVALLRVLEERGSSDMIISSWAAVQLVHVVLRYRALRTLLFPTLSTKRTALLAAASVRGRPLPCVAEANEEERVFADPWDVQPRVRLGVASVEAFGGALPPMKVLQAYVEAYGGEGYILVWREGAAHVMLKKGHTQIDLVRAVWQAAWLDWRTTDGAENGLATATGVGGVSGIAADVPHSEVTHNATSTGASTGDVTEELQLVRASLAALEANFASFLSGCERAGWEVGVVQMKTGRSRLRVGVLSTDREGGP